MEIISAGWRMEYIEKGNAEGCIFCNKPAAREDAKNFIIRRGRAAFVIMNLYPYTTGHLMIAPYRHTGSLCDLSEEEATELMKLVGWSELVLRKSMGAQGFNVGMNIGKCAGAGFPDHVHLHVVPRWEGDTNFMPVFSETRVLPDTLENVYEKIMKVAGGLEDSCT
ncbi:MAG: HIT domain-containing protein [bacterium]